MEWTSSSTNNNKDGTNCCDSCFNLRLPWTSNSSSSRNKIKMDLIPRPKIPRKLVAAGLNCNLDQSRLFVGHNNNFDEGGSGCGDGDRTGGYSGQYSYYGFAAPGTGGSAS